MSGEAHDACFYCAGPLELDRPPEHIIPAAIGGGLVTMAVCANCNARAGREVDRPLMADWFVAVRRNYYALPDRRDQPVRRTWEKISLGGGQEALVSTDGTPPMIRPLPVVEKTQDTVKIRGTEAEIEKIQARLQRDYPDLVWVSGGREEPGQITVTQRKTIAPDIWPRFAAKVALGALSLVCDDNWLKTSQANELRQVLWHGASHTGAFDVQGDAWSPTPLEVRTSFLHAPEHAVFLETSRSTGRVAFASLVLFSDLLYRVPLQPDGISEVRAWVLDPVKRRVSHEDSSPDELLAILKQRHQAS